MERQNIPKQEIRAQIQGERRHSRGEIPAAILEARCKVKSHQPHDKIQTNKDGLT